MLSQVASNVRKKKGFDPDAVEAQMAAAPAPAGASVEVKPEEAPGEKKDLNSRMALAILALAPALAGYAAGGDQGGAIGAQAGTQGVKDVLAGEEKTKALEREKDEKDKEFSLKDRATKAQEANYASEADYRKGQLEVARREVGVKEREQAKKAAGGTIQDRLNKLSGEEKKRVDSQIMGLKAVQDMKDAYLRGNNTFSLIGDNDFTFARNRYTEAIGRLQSGGQISGNEAKTFLGFVPGPTDSKEMQVKKLQEAERELTSRLGTSGFAPADFQIQPVDMIARAKELGNTDVLSALVPEAHAASKPTMTPADFARLQREEKIRLIRGLGKF